MGEGMEESLGLPVVIGISVAGIIVGIVLVLAGILLPHGPGTSCDIFPETISSQFQ
jgi:hypothetical protein